MYMYMAIAWNLPLLHLVAITVLVSARVLAQTHGQHLKRTPEVSQVLEVIVIAGPVEIERLFGGWN